MNASCGILGDSLQRASTLGSSLMAASSRESATLEARNTRPALRAAIADTGDPTLALESCGMVSRLYQGIARVRHRDNVRCRLMSRHRLVKQEQ